MKIAGWPETACTKMTRQGIELRCSTAGCDGTWSNRSIPPADKVIQWAQQSGWEIAKGFKSATCPGCMHKRESSKVKDKADSAKQNLRIVMAALEDHYDDAAKCYDDGWDDAKIAADLGLSIEFVAKTRDDFFGPAEDKRIGDLRAEILAARKAMDAELAELHGMIDDARGRWTARIDELGTKLAGLSK